MPFSSNVFSVKYSGLCRKHSLSPRKALTEIFNMDGSNLPKWRNDESIPKSDLIYAVAEYFNVSTDYLFGREIPSAITAVDNYTVEEYEIIISLRMVDRKTQKLALAAMNGVLQAHKELLERAEAEKKSVLDDSDE